MAERSILVAAHGFCFDGLTSAALFTDLRRALSDDQLAFSYISCGYSPTLKTIPDRWLRGDENAVVDFRYAPTRKLHWYFDHHVTGFGSEEERRNTHLDDDHLFFKDDYSSCAKLIADTAAEHFKVDLSRHQSLIQWADRIDSAKFESAEQAIDRSHPVMQLAAVIENCGDTKFYKELVPRLLKEPLSAVTRSDTIQDRWCELAIAYQTAFDRMREASALRGEVVFADLHQSEMQGSAKFVCYAVFPETRYSVTLLRTKKHYKISVGYNPWSPHPRGHDIAKICARHGGGGHPVVGAINIDLSKTEQAQALAAAITDELNEG